MKEKVKEEVWQRLMCLRSKEHFPALEVNGKIKNETEHAIDLAISKTVKAIFDEELFFKKFTKTERGGLEKKYLG